MSSSVEAPQAAPKTTTTPTTSGSSSGAAVQQSSSRGGNMRDALRQADGYDAQVQMLSPVQRKGGGAGDVHAAAAHGISGGGGALPHGDAIQKSFGAYDLSNVQAHTDSAAAQGSAAMGADAYATGNHVAFNGAPDLHTAAHEAAHVVQQQAGVQLSGGVGEVGDKYEQHADQVADAVVAGKDAQPILSQMAGGGGAGGVQQQSVQQKRKKKDDAGAGAGAMAGDKDKDKSKDKDKDDPAAEAEKQLEKQLKALTAVKSAATLEELQSKGRSAASKGAVSKDSMSRLNGRMRRLNNSRARAEKMWSPAEKAKHWDERLLVVQGAIPGAAAKAIDPVLTSRTIPPGGIDITNILWDLNSASGFKAYAVEDRVAPVETIKKGGGLARVFRLSDVWDRAIPWASKTEWQNHSKAKSMDEAKAKWQQRVVSKGKLPTIPGFDLYTNPINGFMALAESAKSVSDKASAVDAFALEPSYLDEPALLMIKVSGEQVEEQSKAGKAVGKPSIFNHLEFDEFLYAEHDSELGELAVMNKKGKATEKHNGKKEVKVTMFSPSFWVDGQVLK